MLLVYAIAKMLGQTLLMKGSKIKKNPKSSLQLGQFKLSICSARLEVLAPATAVIDAPGIEVVSSTATP